MTTAVFRSVIDRLNRYVDRLLDRTAERLAPRVANRITDDFESRIATLETLTDAEVMDDLRVASGTPAHELIDYEDIRREAGLA